MVFKNYKSIKNFSCKDKGMFKKFLSFSLCILLCLTVFSGNKKFMKNGFVVTKAEDACTPYETFETASVPSFKRSTGGNVFARKEAAIEAAKTCLVETKDLGDGKKHVTITYTGQPSTSDPHLAFFMSGYKVVSENMHFTVTPSVKRTDGNNPDVVFDWPTNSPNSANSTGSGLHDDGIIRVITPNPTYPALSSEPNAQALQGWYRSTNRAEIVNFMKIQNRLNWDDFPAEDKRGADFEGTIDEFYYFRSENMRMPVGSEDGNTHEPIKVEFDVEQTSKANPYIGAFFKSYDYAKQWMRITTIGDIPGETLTKEEATKVVNDYIDSLKNLSKAQKDDYKAKIAAVNEVLKEGDDNIAKYTSKDTIRNLAYFAEQQDKDMKALREAYNNACTVKSSDKYKNATPESKAAYDEAIKNAKDIIDGNKIPVDGDKNKDGSIPNAIEKLKTAENSLKPQTDADKYTPKDPAKTPVKDLNKLTDDEKAKVQKAVEDANKDNFPEGTKVTVADDGTVTVTYPDNTTDTISKDKTVENGGLTKKPANKVEVGDPAFLTEEEKKLVISEIEKANGGKIPGNGTITIANDGTATITYPDGKTETIPGSELVVKKNNGSNGNVNVVPSWPSNPVNTNTLPNTGMTDNGFASLFALACGSLGLLLIKKNKD